MSQNPYDTALVRKMARCLPFADADAGIVETQQAMMEAAAEIDGLHAATNRIQAMTPDIDPREVRECIFGVNPHPKPPDRSSMKAPSTVVNVTIAAIAGTILGFAVGFLTGVALVRVPEPPPPRRTTPTMPVSAPVEPEPVARTIRDLFDAIAQVETGGERDPDAATGDGGRSIGRYQIGRAYWIDSGISGEWEDVRDPAYAESVMLAYWGRYEPEALLAGDFEPLARCHNGGGPLWRKYPATLAYWHRVREAMQ